MFSNTVELRQTNLSANPNSSPITSATVNDCKDLHNRSVINLDLQKRILELTAQRFTNIQQRKDRQHY